MNIQKSVLFVAGVSPLEMQTLSNHGLKMGIMPFRYLGLPLMTRKLRIHEFSPLIDAIQKRFSSWQAKKISYAGRLQLLKSVIFSLINFWGDAFCFPKGCVMKIEQMCQRFLWSGQTEEVCAHKVAWAEVCKPKSAGGLGMRNLYKWNKTLLLKLAWRLKTAKDSLWVQFMSEHYLKNKWIWTVNSRDSDSWVWKSILSPRPLIRTFLTSIMRDGRETSFWYDIWASPMPLVDICGEERFIRLGIPKCASVFDVARIGIWNRKQRRGRLRNPLLNRVLELVTSQPVPSSNEVGDSWSWSREWNTQRIFTTKYTWESLQAVDENPRWSKVVWFKGNIPKCAFISWLAMLDRLPTMERLHTWGCAQTLLCCLCNKLPDSREHLFIRCESVERIWWGVTRKLGGYAFIFHDWGSMITWLLTDTLQVSKTLKRVAVQITLYQLWLARNSKMYEQNQFSVELILKKIDRQVRNVILARQFRASFTGLLQQWFRWE